MMSIGAAGMACERGDIDLDLVLAILTCDEAGDHARVDAVYLFGHDERLDPLDRSLGEAP